MIGIPVVYDGEDVNRRYGLKPRLAPDELKVYYQKITQTRLDLAQRKVSQLEEGLNQMRADFNS